MSGYTDESRNSATRLSRASPAPARCSRASSWVSMGLAVTLVTRRQVVTRVMEVSMVMCAEILMRPGPSHHFYHCVSRITHAYAAQQPTRTLGNDADILI